MKFTVGKRGGVKTLCLFREDVAAIKGEKEDGQPGEKEKEVRYAREKVGFEGKAGETFFFPAAGGGEEILLLGMGEKEKLTGDGLREICFQAGTAMEKNGIEELTLSLSPEDAHLTDAEELGKVVTEGFLQATYRFDKYKTKPEEAKKREQKERRIYLDPGTRENKGVRRGVRRAKKVMEGVFLTRDLVNEPANVLYPARLAEKAEKFFRGTEVKVEVLGEKEIRKLGMEAFLSVAGGSDREPKLIVMEYRQDPSTDQTIALVGKGITYDSGGYSLKPSDSMKTMASDMAGAATVIGTMQALRLCGIKTNAIGVIACCENLVSGRAYKPGDIIGSMAGKTIEIDNTDAEGRLTLADAVYFASKTKGASSLIDLATLTGACVVALGEEYTGAVTNDSAFLASFLAAARKTGERVWELPADEDFAKKNESDVADIKNSGGRLGGAISAGLFVGAFVDENKPWIHLDIAGTAYREKAQHYLPSHATGIMVKTLVEFLDGKGAK